MNINNLLISWFQEHARELPWKSDRDPYKVWVSEVLLQQTRVEQAKHYYLRFISRFPSVEDLAGAPLDELLRLWQGLGYYSRARNMHAAARQIVEQFGGVFPSSSREIATLKGVGPYTAAAVAAFAFDEPVVALDGNAFRVFARLFEEETPIDTPAAREVFTALTQSCLASTSSSIFNQAVMDFGSLVCTPYPKCEICPLTSLCLAYARDKVRELPVKKKKQAPRNRYFYYLHIQHHNDIFIQQRCGKDIWQRLWQFPLIETERAIPPDELVCNPQWTAIFESQIPHITGFSSKYIHRLTHQILHTFFIRVDIPEETAWLRENCKKIPASQIDGFGIPRLMERYLSDQSINDLYLNNANA